jgi:hypothetical protein
MRHSEAITLSRIACTALRSPDPTPNFEFMALKHVVRVLGSFAAASALTVTLLPTGAVSAQTSSPGIAGSSLEPMSKKKGPPPGTTTETIQGWVQDKLTEWHTVCGPTTPLGPNCTVQFKWSKLRWMGTTKICVKGAFGQPCLEYGTAYVARVDILLTESWDTNWGNPSGPVNREQRQYRYGYWEGGRKMAPYQPRPGGPTWQAECSDCGKDLYVRKGKFGRWFFGFGGTPYYLR